MKYSLLLFVLVALCSCVKSKDDKQEKKTTEKYAGTFNLVSLTKYDYDTTTGKVINTTTATNVGEVRLGVDPDGLAFNDFYYKLTTKTRLMFPLENVNAASLGADGSRSCYWVSDFGEKRILIYGFTGGGSFYVQANLEQPDKSHMIFTYIQTTTGWDGGTGTAGTLKGKEVWMLEKK